MKEAIRIYARLKPFGNETPCRYDVSSPAVDDDLSEKCEAIEFCVPKSAADNIVNNSREVYRFHFDKIFSHDSTQSAIFEHVTRPVVDSVLDGYNGTLFAYGQTGSGKTYTITGLKQNLRSPESGIIPRALSYIFDKLSKKDEEYSVSISYFEIYNETGYDLLQSRDHISALEDLPKIALLEDADQNIHIRNLSVHGVSNADTALELFKTGEMNRAMAETPLNKNSTRSHCIFTVILKSRKNDSAIVCTSKLHVIDLAGSERVYKSGIVGRSLTEAKYINLGLHHLEQVILALGDKQRGHVPYRNSLMTTVLKDSLGGNSLTSMIATCSLEENNIGETISTCRFAQRVAMIKNEAVRNEVLSPEIEIQLLKKQVACLKASYALLSGKECIKDSLDEKEVLQCKEAVNEFLDGGSELLFPDMDWRKIHLAFNFMKDAVVQARSVATNTDAPASDYVSKLETSLVQRDRELAILCKLLRQEKKKVDKMMVPKSAPAIYSSKPSEMPPQNLESGEVDTKFVPPAQFAPWIRSVSKLTPEQLDEFRRALLMSFIESHGLRPNIDDLKRKLNCRVIQARELGTRIRSTQSVIAEKQEQSENIEEPVVFKELLVRSEDEEYVYGAAKEGHIKATNAHLQNMLQKLRSLRGEVDLLEKSLRNCTDQIQKDFDFWWTANVLADSETGSGDG